MKLTIPRDNCDAIFLSFLLRSLLCRHMHIHDYLFILQKGVVILRFVIYSYSYDVYFCILYLFKYHLTNHTWNLSINILLTIIQRSPFHFSPLSTPTLVISIFWSESKGLFQFVLLSRLSGTILDLCKNHPFSFHSAHVI